MSQKVYSYEDVYNSTLEYFNGDELATKVFINKYALRNKEQELLEKNPNDMHWRIANELARIEKDKFKNPMSSSEIFEYLKNFERIIPQGSPMSGIGNDFQYTSLSNCYVIEPPVDSYGGIHLSDEQLTQISKRRGGTGLDISNLRPNGTPTSNAAKTSTGIVPFMERFSNSIREVGQSGRRGALMISISIHHPEVSECAKIKRDKKKVTGANISIRLSDEFLKAVEEDKEYEQRWPVDSKNPVVSKMVSARKVWMQFIESAWDCAEPGLLFWDNIIRESPADCYPNFKTIGTNPCGEVPLSALDSCRLLVKNIFYYVKNPFTNKAYLDFDLLKKDSMIAQRFMDDIIDLELEAVTKIINKIKNDPEENRIKRVELEMWQNIKKTCQDGRRTGVGVTALGDAIAALGLKYGSPKSIEVVDEIYKTIKLGCYRSSVEMAKELGTFPSWNFELEKNNPYLLRIKEEDKDLWEDNKKYGRRNISTMTTAPSGSVSIESRTSNGIEPIFKLSYKRRRKINPNEQNVRVDFVDDSGDSWEEFTVYHPKVKEWMAVTGETDLEKSPWFGCCASDLDWKKRVKLQATAQRHIDHSISSTVNLPKEATVEDVAKIYEEAWKLGCKGITIYREGSRAGVMLDESENSNTIVKTNAPKRPKKLPCDVHHVSVKGKQYFVLVGLFNGEPYEIFADKNGLISKGVDKGELIKVKRGQYKAVFNNGQELDNLTLNLDDLEDTITRLVSCSLRHGAEIKFLVQQLEKSKGDIMSFEKAIARALKKYIKDGTLVTGETCQSCNSSNLTRNAGCVTCMDCGWSKCS